MYVCGRNGHSGAVAYGNEAGQQGGGGWLVSIMMRTSYSSEVVKLTRDQHPGPLSLFNAPLYRLEKLMFQARNWQRACKGQF